MKLLMYGAGSIGRGFIGPLFAASGYEVVFIDINKKLIDEMNTRHGYHFTVAAEQPFDIHVTGIRGIDGSDEESILYEISSCDIMAVSLGAANLKSVAPIIANGFLLRMKASDRPLNLLICENLKDAAHLLRSWLSEELSEGDKLLLTDKCGLIETAIGRMVPVAEPNPHDLLHITVEEYGFLPVDKDAFIGDFPQVKNLIPYSPFLFYEERKLYLHNMGHALCAYFGESAGYDTIAETVSDFSIRYMVLSAMIETSTMLSVKYSVPFSEVFQHAEDLLMRFGNVTLGDTCERVGRDLLRKLKAGDRLAGALSECWKHEVYPVYCALGYAFALRKVTDCEAEAVKIAKNIGELTSEQTELVMMIFLILDKPITEILKTVERLKKAFRGNII